MCSGSPAQAAHAPVLFQEAVEGLRVRPGGTYIDATLGGGGHAEGILERSAPGGRLLGIDKDPEAVSRAAARLAPYSARIVLRVSSFSMVADVATGERFTGVDGVLLDLGLSSSQLADWSRGFAFSKDGPLDMRYNQSSDLPTAADLLDSLSVAELRDLLRDYGEERHARRIAAAIVAAGPVATTGELARIVSEAVPGYGGRIHPATRTFQALRIAVNSELDEIAMALPQTVGLLAPGGRLAVISFHSLEDRLVKRFLRTESRDCICDPEAPACQCSHTATLRRISRKPVRPSAQEVRSNRRARSARLRIAERVGPQQPSQR